VTIGTYVMSDRSTHFTRHLAISLKISTICRNFRFCLSILLVRQYIRFLKVVHAMWAFSQSDLIILFIYAIHLGLQCLEY